jgi:hypothetical protein
MGKFCSQTFDLFMNRGSIVYYAGVYTMHNLRGAHAPGSDIPADVVSIFIIYSHLRCGTQLCISWFMLAVSDRNSPRGATGKQENAGLFPGWQDEGQMLWSTILGL